jgi:hypothetical protein
LTPKAFGVEKPSTADHRSFLAIRILDFKEQSTNDYQPVALIR